MVTGRMDAVNKKTLSAVLSMLEALWLKGKCPKETEVLWGAIGKRFHMSL
jgi:hypothetical protein